MEQLADDFRQPVVMHEDCRIVDEPIRRAEARLAARGGKASFGQDAVSDEVLRNIEEFGQEEVDELEDLISTGADRAETIVLRHPLD